MARLPRVVVPHYPHHVTQRGGRRQETFFCAADFRAYTDFLAKSKSEADVEIWAYCLMPNHVHFVAVPSHVDGLSDMFGSAHLRYTRRINRRENWRGHLWQERFYSCVLDEAHLLAAVRYAELNPVRARLCNSPTDWPWSSARAHVRGIDDRLVTVAPMLGRINNWRNYLETYDHPAIEEAIRKHSRTGRPLGDDGFVKRLEFLMGRYLRKKKPGPKKQK